MKKRKILFVCHAVKWFDKVNGNTYHSVRITRCRDGKVICGAYQYGYGDQYRQTALEEMHKNNWIPQHYGERLKNGSDTLHMYERENNYPIEWIVSDGLKKDCINNGVA